MDLVSHMSEVEKMQMALLNLAARLSQQAPQEELLTRIAELLDHCQNIGSAAHG